MVLSDSSVRQWREDAGECPTNFQGVVGVARRVRLDVRWDQATVDQAVAVAEARGVRPAAVLREAAARGLAAMAAAGAPTAAALRAESTAGEGSAGRAGKMGGARSPGDGVGSTGAAAAPRPAAASGAQQKLAVVVARAVAAGEGRTPALVDVTRARRKIELGKVTVGGAVVTDPDALVDPGAVAA